jgi:hypothetical protein
VDGASRAGRRYCKVEAAPPRPPRRALASDRRRRVRRARLMSARIETDLAQRA